MKPRPDELSENDPVLATLGYNADYDNYRRRISRINALALEGKGPGAWHDRFMKLLGYKSTWTPAKTK